MEQSGNNTLKFYGEAFRSLDSHRPSYVIVNGVRHDLLSKTFSKFNNCSNAKEFAEVVEAFAYLIFIENSISNDQYFSE